MDNSITTLEMCAGYGGIGLGLKNIFGERLRTLAYCELEGFAQANLISKMEAGLLDVAPIWSDLKTFPYGSFHGLVDILIAGYPCQPFSAAGKRLGAEDPRHLWPHIARAIGIIRPRLCFFENVEGHISLGLREVIGELEGIGYTASWGIFSASEVGAPHQRKRVFILAVYNSLGGAAGVSRSLAWNEGIAGEFDHGGGEGVGELADTGRIEPQGWCGAADGQQSGAGRIPRGESTPRHDQVWPSRPGEQQYAWEPPRVVVDAKSQRAGQRSELCSEECGSGSALPRDIEQSGEATLANDHSPHAGHGEQRPERTLRDLSGGCGEAMGNATSERDFNQTQQDNTEAGVDFDRAGEGERMAHTHGSRGEEPRHKLADILTEPSGCCAETMGNADPRRFASGINAGSGAEADRGGQSDIEQAESGQAQPSVGRDADGPTSGMDYAELQVSCDNRTDELRLLGNGVVPATAERAFRTLCEELSK